MCQVVELTKESNSCNPKRPGVFFSEYVNVEDVDSITINEVTGVMNITLKVGKTWTKATANNEYLGYDHAFNPDNKKWTHQVMVGREGSNFNLSFQTANTLAMELIFVGMTMNGEKVVVGGIDFMKDGNVLRYGDIRGLRLATDVANSGTIKDGGATNTASWTATLMHPVYSLGTCSPAPSFVTP
jgi:hypothetical protein